MTPTPTPDDAPGDDKAAKKKTLVAACVAHATHDGLSDLVYVFLPIWQDMFMLSYVWLSILRSAYALTLASLQIPASTLATRIRPEYLLVITTLVTGLGWLTAGWAGSATALGLALVLAGIGASAQHPVASALVSRAYGRSAKRPLSLYNFSGDLGKSLLPASAALLLTWTSYGNTVTLYAGIAVLVALCIGALLRQASAKAPARQDSAGLAPGELRVEDNPGAFHALLCTAILDSAVRMGLLIFLPFIIKENGGSLVQIGMGLTLVFIGGALGKFFCGWMADSFGAIRTIIVTELATALLIGVVLSASLGIGLLALPLLGAVLNGTSSVLYGSVTDVVDSRKLEKAFSIFYTGTIGSGALAPILYGYAGDHLGVTTATAIVAITAVLALFPVVLYSLRKPGTFDPQPV